MESAHIVKFIGQGLTEERAREEIQRAKDEIERGEEFGAVAERYSDCPADGGQAGIFPRGELTPEYEAVVFALRPGQYSDIFRTGFGFHIAKTLSKKAARPARFEEVENDIWLILAANAEQQALRKALDALWKKSNLTSDSEE